MSALDLDAVTMTPQPRAAFLCPSALGGERESLDWSQTTDHVSLFVPLLPATRARDLRVSIRPRDLLAARRDGGEPLVCGRLFEEVDISESEWVVEKGELVISLRKARQREWVVPLVTLKEREEASSESSAMRDHTSEMPTPQPPSPAPNIERMRATGKAEGDVEARAHSPVPTHDLRQKIDTHTAPGAGCQPQQDPLRKKYAEWSQFDEDEAVMAVENEGKSAEEPNWAMRSTPGVAALQATDYVKDKEEISLDRDLAVKHKELQTAFNERLADAARLKQRGNEQMRKHEETLALQSYLEGADALELITGDAAPLLSGRLAAAATDLRRDLLNNAAQAALQARDWESTIACASAALAILAKSDDASSVSSRCKALFRRASAYVGSATPDIEKARDDLLLLLKQQPQNKAARAFLESDALNPV